MILIWNCFSGVVQPLFLWFREKLEVSWDLLKGNVSVIFISAYSATMLLLLTLTELGIWNVTLDTYLLKEFLILLGIPSVQGSGLF